MEEVKKSHNLGPHLINAFVILAVLAVVGYGGIKVYSKMTDIQKENQLALANYTEMNKKNILLKVIDSKLDLSTAKKVKLRDTLYDMCYLYDIPVSLICGMIEIESAWNPDATSEANAKGLMQLLPSTARPYLRNERIEYNDKILFDPVVNVLVGISYLSDLQKGHIEAGKTKEDDFTFALHSFFWGTENTKQLYGKKDQRVNVPNLAYPNRIVEATKKYKEMGL